MTHDLHRLLLEVVALSREAGHAILGVYASSFTVQAKDDSSPLTEADLRSQEILARGLRRLLPEVPILSEESEQVPWTERSGWDWLWVVDPLDGTREFVSRNGEFTVNIALVEQGLPVLGVVFVPVSGVLYSGIAGQGAWLEEQGRRHAIRCRRAPDAGWVLACSRSHGDEAALTAWLAGRAVSARIDAGSSLKFGLVARGLADVYPRLGRTMEWDTAAGHAVLRAAGGEVLTLGGEPLRYGKPGFENPHFVARGLASRAEPFG